MNSSASSQSQRRVDPWLVAIVLGTAISGALIVARARNWAVMTDELLYTGMARSIAQSVFPFAALRGEHLPVNQVLFPTMIAPLVGALSMPVAYSFIAALNAIVFATAAIPAYLLTNLVTANRSAARWVALCTVVTPWLAFASKALPDPLAYVAVLWAAYAMVRTAGANERPLRGDLLMLLAIALAYLVRNQFLLLVGVWVAAVVLCRIGETLGDKTWRELPRELVALLKDRPLPFITFVLVILLVKFQPVWILGLYTVTTSDIRGGALPGGLIHAFFNHASVVALGVAGLPFVLGLPWLVVALTRVKERVQNDAAIVIVLLSCAVLVVAASFDVRFAESDRVIERYIFYFAPLMFVAMAAFFIRPPKSLAAFALPAIAGLLLLNASEPFGLDQKLNFQINHAFSPMQIGLVVYQKSADAIGTSIFGLMTVAMIALAGGAWWLLQSGKATVALNTSFALVFAVVLTTTIYTVPKVVNLQNELVDKGFGYRTNTEKAWLDQATNDEPVSLVYSPRLDITDKREIKRAERTSNWWDLAFWNESISAVYVSLSGNPTQYNPLLGVAFTMKPNWETGELKRASGDKAEYLAQSATSPNFAPHYAGTPITRAGFTIYDTGTDATASWATQGLTARGWVPPAGATLRVWGSLDETRRIQIVRLTVATRRAARRLAGFKVVGADQVKVERIGPRIRYSWPVEIIPGEHQDFRLVRGGGNVHVEKIDVSAPQG
ncbi:MAG: hypothetical protein HYX29_03575 [Solirubrobacterales bacterium]|nr:hypothetical protein [Solirubrobacterales bacterium]